MAINYELESSADNYNKILRLLWHLKVAELTTSKHPVSLAYLYITSWAGFHSPSLRNFPNQVLEQKNKSGLHILKNGDKVTGGLF